MPIPAPPFRHSWFVGWQNARPGEFCQACTWLWNRLFPVAHTYLDLFDTRAGSSRPPWADKAPGPRGAADFFGRRLGIDGDLATDLAADAFWDALEDVDWRLSGGAFLITESYVREGDLSSPQSFVAGVREGRTSLFRRVESALPGGSAGARLHLRRFAGTGLVSQRLVDSVIVALNRILHDRELCKDPSVVALPATEEPRDLESRVGNSQTADDQDVLDLKPVLEMNRRLLEASWPGDLRSVGARADPAWWGIVSHRQLRPRRRHARTPIEWDDERRFTALVRSIWIRRGQDRLRRARPAQYRGAAEGETWESFAGLAGDLRKWVLDRQAIISLVRALACESERLPDGSCRELLEASLLYVKLSVAACNRHWKARGPDLVGATPIEELVWDADVEALDASGEGWRQFLLEVLFDDATEADMGAAADEFMRKLPTSGPRTGAVPISCTQVRAQVGPLVEGASRFARQFGDELLARLSDHLAGCAGCRLALGGTLASRRRRNTLDQRIRRSRRALHEIYVRVSGAAPRNQKGGGYPRNHATHGETQAPTENELRRRDAALPPAPAGPMDARHGAAGPSPGAPVAL